MNLAFAALSLMAMLDLALFLAGRRMEKNAERRAHNVSRGLETPALGGWW